MSLANALLDESALQQAEPRFPLRVWVCTGCWLVQTEECSPSPQLFGENYPYFSSFSTSWLRHAEDYVAAAAKRFRLDANSMVVEVGCNDGYLLRYVKGRGIPCLGVEPTAGTAQEAVRKGIDVVEEFFGVPLAMRLIASGNSADLAIANNVLAHVPDVDGFVGGFAALLKPQGAATFEFPHLLQQVRHCQFDTIYHEHFSYLSLTCVQKIFAQNGLAVFDVEKLPTHGGSLRVFAQRSDAGVRDTESSVHELLAAEGAAGVPTEAFYSGFQGCAERVRHDFLSFLREAKGAGKTIAAYGAAAKGNTLMNYAGVGPELIKFVVDRNPAKQGKFMPGSHIPIVDETRLHQEKPDYVVLLPWNLKSELMPQLEYVRAWGAKLVTAIPRLEVA